MRAQRSSSGDEANTPIHGGSLGLLEEALRSSRAQMDEYVEAWVRNLGTVRDTLPEASGGRSPERFPEAVQRLKRFCEALRRARVELELGALRHTAQNVRVRTVSGGPLVEHDKTERLLAAADVELLRRMADQEQLEADGRASERSTDEAQARFERAFTSAPIGMALVDLDGRWIQVNDALCRITGRTRDEFGATTLQAITHPDDIDADADSMRELKNGKIPSHQIEKRYRHAWGHYLWVQVTVSLVRDDRGVPRYFVSQVQDISERKELAARLEYLIDHDFLTGLFNRKHFQQEIAHQADRVSRYGAKGAVLMIDLDNFKDVNDAFGHKAGDDLLKGVAGALKHRGRQTDTVARVGGDEFAMLLPEADADQAQTVADGIVKTLSRQVAVLGERSIQITASVGVALFDEHSAQEVLEFADLAMYEAKQAGRNRVALYTASGGHREQVSARRVTTEMVRHALEEDRLLLYCQPIVDLRRNEVCQYELLLRLRTDDVDAPLSPSAFLYVAERFGLIQKFDVWVARHAAALIAQQARAGRKLVLHVNLSGKSIGDPRVASMIEEAIQDAGIDPACLVFELTETAAIANIEEAKAFAHRLRVRGCRLALDDFGAGFGSFYYLKTLPFDYYKIDGEFIRDLVASPMDQLVVAAIVGIAKGMGKKTIAEFVADEDTARLLAKLGVDYAQGYQFGRPRPVSDVLSPP